MKLLAKIKRDYKVCAMLFAKEWYPELFFKQQIYIREYDIIISEYHEFDDGYIENKTTLAVCKDQECANYCWKYYTMTKREKKLERICNEE